MSHSLNKMWLHVIFSTRDRAPLIKKDVEEKVHKHIKEQLIECGNYVKIINGIPDHVHLLFLQNPKMAVMDTIKQIKGNTAHWINKEDIIAEKFAWQTGYASYSVSESQVEKVYQYISNQKTHHQKKTFIQEYDEFILAHGIVLDNKNG